jgi:NADPH:quinone reductase-like Zn-dependent oxidoreductase
VLLPAPPPLRTARARSERPAHLQRVQAFINKGLAEGSLWPIVARTIPLEELVEALRHLEASPRFGEVVVTA